MLLSSWLVGTALNVNIPLIKRELIGAQTMSADIKLKDLIAELQLLALKSKLLALHARNEIRFLLLSTVSINRT
jgi:hypothetical protein